MKRKALVYVGIILIALALGELGARYFLGLGTPTLSVTHPRIEYMFAPNQDVRRFGNRQLINEYGMRSPAMSEWGSARRVLVFGDSVLNGGNLTDHEALATTLATRDSPGSVFGNVSAGSWGVDNMLGWIETYGLLDADTVIFVLSSHDAVDAPTFTALNPMTQPTTRPVSALWEGIQRYLPRYLPQGIAGRLQGTRDPGQPIETTHFGENGAVALPIVLNMLREAGIEACGVLHATRAERLASDYAGLDRLAEIFEQYGVPVLRMYEVRTQNPLNDDPIYRDEIHINAAGQQVLKAALLRCDMEATEHRDMRQDD
jgi:hypothetical protein